MSQFTHQPIEIKSWRGGSEVGSFVGSVAGKWLPRVVQTVRRQRRDPPRAGYVRPADLIRRPQPGQIT